MGSQAKRITAAILLSGLLAWPVMVQAEEGVIDQIYRVSGWIEPTTPLSDVCIVWGFGHHALHTRGLYLDGTFAPNVRTPFSADFTIQADELDPYSPWNYYGVFGLHDSANDGVTMALRPAWAQTVVSQNFTWNEAWRMGWEPPTQARVANWLRTRVDTIPMTGFMGNFEFAADDVGQRTGQQASLVSFSTPSADGSALVNVAIVPEPATMTLAGIAGILVLSRRRR